MEPLSSLNDGHYDCGYAGSIKPVQTISQQHRNITRKNNSKVRLNDQLIPKPTDINIGKKLSTIPPPKQHPYSSHISRFAMFPSFCCSDDPHTGVRAALQPFLQPRVPNRAQDVTVLSKTIGGPHRHEILGSPMKTREKADAAPSNAKLRDWELSLSERNMLRNLEQALWVTSYQMHYTGSGPANPLKIDGFKEKMSGLAEINSHSAPLRERSYPVFVPSKPVRECRRKQESVLGRSPTAAELLNPSSASTNRQRSPGIVAEHNEDPDLNPKDDSQSGNRMGSTEAERTERSHEILRRQQKKHNVYESRERERSNVQFDPGIDSHTELISRADLEQEKLGDIRDMSSSISHPRILPRPPGLSGVHLLDGAGTVGRDGTALSLLDLQSSFSRSEAHCNFNSSVNRAAVSLRDNVVTGKKHNFYGINCYYLRG